jgi:hypothetical protein
MPNFKLSRALHPGKLGLLYPLIALALVSVLLISFTRAAQADTGTFSNTTAISIPSSGSATPYPSDITVSGLNGTIIKVTATLTGLNRGGLNSLRVLLVGPNNQTVVLQGWVNSSATNVDLTFDDAATATLPCGKIAPTAVSSGLVSGTYKPTQCGASASSSMVSSAPAGPYGTTLSVFNGTNPNGLWHLYVADDVEGPSEGGITGGWSLTIITATPVANDDGYSTPFNTALTVAAPGVLANDTDPSSLPLTTALATNPTHGTLSLNANGGFTYTPTTGFSGTDSFTYRANNGVGNSNLATVTIAVGVPLPTPTTSADDRAAGPPADLIAQLRVTPDRVAANNPDNLITFSFTVKNMGQGEASFITLDFPIDPDLVVGYASFVNPKAWVKSVTTDTLFISLPPLKQNEVITGTITFQPKTEPAPAIGNQLFVRYKVRYDDPSGAGKWRLSNAVALEFGAPGSNHDVSGGAIQLLAPANVNLTVGATQTFKADFFIPNELINVWLTRPDGTSVALTGGQADALGNFDGVLNTTGLTPGTYTLAIYGNRSEVTGSAVLVVE